MDQLAGLPESARKLAFERFQMLRPYLEENQPLEVAAAAAEISLRTAQRWVAQYQRFGDFGSRIWPTSAVGVAHPDEATEKLVTPTSKERKRRRRQVLAVGSRNLSVEDHSYQINYLAWASPTAEVGQV